MYHTKRAAEPTSGQPVAKRQRFSETADHIHLKFPGLTDATNFLSGLAETTNHRQSIPSKSKVGSTSISTPILPPPEVAVDIIGSCGSIGTLKWGEAREAKFVATVTSNLQAAGDMAELLKQAKEWNNSSTRPVELLHTLKMASFSEDARAAATTIFLRALRSTKVIDHTQFEDIRARIVYGPQRHGGMIHAPPTWGANEMRIRTPGVHICAIILLWLAQLPENVRTLIMPTLTYCLLFGEASFPEAFSTGSLRTKDADARIRLQTCKRVLHALETIPAEHDRVTFAKAAITAYMAKTSSIQQEIHQCEQDDEVFLRALDSGTFPDYVVLDTVTDIIISSALQKHRLKRDPSICEMEDGVCTRWKPRYPHLGSSLMFLEGAACLGEPSDFEWHEQAAAKIVLASWRILGEEILRISAKLARIFAQADLRSLICGVSQKSEVSWLLAIVGVVPPETNFGVCLAKEAVLAGSMGHETKEVFHITKWTGGNARKRGPLRSGATAFLSQVDALRKTDPNARRYDDLLEAMRLALSPCMYMVATQAGTANTHRPTITQFKRPRKLFFMGTLRAMDMPPDNAHYVIEVLHNRTKPDDGSRDSGDRFGSLWKQDARSWGCAAVSNKIQACPWTSSADGDLTLHKFGDVIDIEDLVRDVDAPAWRRCTALQRRKTQSVGTHMSPMEWVSCEA